MQSAIYSANIGGIIIGVLNGSIMDRIMLPSSPDLVDTEWTYAMRRDMQEIIPGLFLGPYSAAMKSKIELLKQCGVTHIVCVRQQIEARLIRPNFPDKFKYLVLDIADTATTNIIQHLPTVKDFIDNCFFNNGKVLIHGNAGISRSATLVIAYIMETYGLQYREAFTLVQQRRFCINPNVGFTQQLREYEPIYRAKLTLQHGETSQVTGKLKRGIQDVEDSDNQ